MHTNLTTAIVSASGSVLVAIVAILSNKKRFDDGNRRMDHWEMRLDHIEQMLSSYCRANLRSARYK